MLKNDLKNDDFYHELKDSIIKKNKSIKQSDFFIFINNKNLL